MKLTKIAAVSATVIAAGLGLAACGTTTVTPVASSPGSSGPGAVYSAKPAGTKSPAPVADAPTMSTAEQQAVDSAQSYLRMGSGFSEYSLLKQLTSSYGSGFSQADAQFAVKYLNPDWDAQAVDAAKGYMKLGGFSAASLTQQLTSDYGNGFTEAEAAYAVAKVGL